MVTMAHSTDSEAVTTMWAAVRESYGTAEELQLRRVEKPALADDAVLVRVHAASVNRYDWYVLRGKPFLARPGLGLLKPKSPLVGGDFAGVVEAVGSAVRTSPSATRCSAAAPARSPST